MIKHECARLVGEERRQSQKHSKVWMEPWREAVRVQLVSLLREGARVNHTRLLLPPSKSTVKVLHGERARSVCSGRYQSQRGGRVQESWPGAVGGAWMALLADCWVVRRHVWVFRTNRQGVKVIIALLSLHIDKLFPGISTLYTSVLPQLCAATGRISELQQLDLAAEWVIPSFENDSCAQLARLETRPLVPKPLNLWPAR